MAKLAITVARRIPAERGRIAETSIGHMFQSREQVAEDLVVHDLDPSFSRIERLFRRGDDEEGSYGIRAGVLAGLATLGRPARLRLKQLVGSPAFTTDEIRLVLGVRRAAMAMGAPDLAPACNRMYLGKGRRVAADVVARARRAEMDCLASLPAFKAWLASVR